MDISVMSLPWPDGLKAFSSGGAHKGWRYYLGVIHNTYHGGNIEADHHTICSIPEKVAKLHIP